MTRHPGYWFVVGCFLAQSLSLIHQLNFTTSCSFISRRFYSALSSWYLWKRISITMCWSYVQ